MDRLALNPFKAGLTKAAEERVNSILYANSEGSKFFEHAKQTAEKTAAKTQQLIAKFESLSRRKDLVATVEPAVTHLMQTWKAEQPMDQLIVHIDMDAFYAQVEELGNPELKTKPIGIGGNVGPLCTANYEARKYGVRAAMPGYLAKKLCPHLIIIQPNFEKYTAIAQKIRAVFAKYDPLFAPMSLDEAYLDISSYVGKLAKEQGCEHDKQKQNEIAESVVQRIRQEIFESTGLTGSAGLTPNKLLSKICSDFNKPNGQFVFLPSTTHELEMFMRDQKIRRVPGVGKVMESLLSGLTITTCGDLIAKRHELSQLFLPSTFHFLLRSSLGLASRFDGKVYAEQSQKSVSKERTFLPSSNPEAFERILKRLARGLWNEMKQDGMKAKNVGIKIKTDTFVVFTRNKQIPNPEKMFAFSRRKKDEQKSTEVKEDNDGDEKAEPNELGSNNVEGNAQTEAGEDDDESETDTTESETGEGTWKDLFIHANQLLSKFLADHPQKPVSLRLLGIRLSNLYEAHDEESSGTLLGFLKAKNDGNGNASSSTSTSATTTSSNALQCPICQEFVQGGLNMLNVHMDGCLRKQQDNHPQKHPSPKRNLFTPNTNSNSPTGASMASAVDSKTTCPICMQHIAIHANDDETLNREMSAHIDLCLWRMENEANDDGERKRKKRKVDAKEKEKEKEKEKSVKGKDLLSYFGKKS